MSRFFGPRLRNLIALCISPDEEPTAPCCCLPGYWIPESIFCFLTLFSDTHPYSNRRRRSRAGSLECGAQLATILPDCIRTWSATWSCCHGGPRYRPIRELGVKVPVPFPRFKWYHMSTSLVFLLKCICMAAMPLILCFIGPGYCEFFYYLDHKSPVIIFYSTCRECCVFAIWK